MYHKYEESLHFTVPTRSNNELFPYVHPTWNVSESLGGFRGYLFGENDVEIAEASIKKLLLYYHRIAIPSGFEYLCDYYRLGEPPAEAARVSFPNYLKLHARLRSLIRKGIVFLMPEVPSFHPARDAVNRLATSDEVAYYLEHSQFDFRKTIEQSLWVGNKFDLDLFLPSNDVINFF